MSDEAMREASRRALASFGQSVLAELRWRSFEHRVMVFAAVMIATALSVLAVVYTLRHLREVQGLRRLDEVGRARRARRRGRR